MTITIASSIGRISVIPSLGMVEVQRDNVAVQDGVPIGNLPPHNHVIAPGDDLTNEDPRVALIAMASQVRDSDIPQAYAVLAPLMPKAIVQPNSI